MTKPIQKILFGSPGTGKSHRVDNEIIPTSVPCGLGISDKDNIIKTVFHPEYTYGDFVGKLMPLTVREGNTNKVSYHYYEGHFLKALAQAYKQVLIYNLKNDKSVNDDDDDDNENDGVSSNLIQNVVLVIDEINRGNSAAIFGTVFQLLDRETDISKNTFGWSSYKISISKLEFTKLIELIGLKEDEKTTSKSGTEIIKYSFDYKKTPRSKNPIKELKDWLSFLFINENEIKIPSNLSILATMNTSDNSIYFMDSAFKRRWDWEFIEIEDPKQRRLLQSSKIILNNGNTYLWCDFVDKLNDFIKSNYEKIRKIEDKQVGYRFINEIEISEEKIKNKLMFFIWDSVFGNNKEPLIKLIFGDSSAENKRKLVTFGDFTKMTQIFIDKIVASYV